MGEHAHSHHGGHHDHSHMHSPKEAASMRPRLLVAFTLALVIVLAQAVGSLVTGSLALLTDTAHAITDASGLLVALTAASLMTRPATSRHTWGFRRIEVLAALGQSVLLLAVGIYTAVEGVHRLFAPPEVPGAELLVFGVVGLVANVIGIAVLASGRNANFNMRAAFLEVLNDALGSLGVIVAAIVIWLTGFYRADALAGLFIAVLIVPRAVRLMRQTTGWRFWTVSVRAWRAILRCRWSTRPSSWRPPSWVARSRSRSATPSRLYVPGTQNPVVRAGAAR